MFKKNRFSITGLCLSALLAASPTAWADEVSATTGGKALIQITISSTTALNFGTMVSSTSSSNTATAFTIPAKAPSSYTAGSDYTVAGGDGYRLTSSTSTPGEISLIANDAEPVTLTLTNGGCSDTGLAFTTLTGTHPQAAGDVTLSAAADGTSATTDITYETGKTAIYIGGTVTVDANTNGESGCSYTVGAAYK